MTQEKKNSPLIIALAPNGRFVIPQSIRRALGLRKGGEVELVPVENGYLLRAPTGSCRLCGATKNLVSLSMDDTEEPIALCKNCISKIRKECPK